MTNYAPSFTVAKLFEKTTQPREGSRLRQKLVHLQYRAKLQEHITLAVTRFREHSAAADAKHKERPSGRGNKGSRMSLPFTIAGAWYEAEPSTRDMSVREMRRMGPRHIKHRFQFLGGVTRSIFA